MAKSFVSLSLRWMIAFFAGVSLAFIAVAAYADDAYAVDASGSGFYPYMYQISENRALTEPGYLNAQGVGFDTWTKKDGYAFTFGTDGNTGCKLIHFTLDPTTGNTKQVKSVKYAVKNIGHANDATVYKKGSKKYLFVAISGGKELATKTTAGKKTKIAIIKLADFNKGKAKVYGCTVVAKKKVKLSKSIKKCAFSGITYTGVRKVSGKKVPVFVLKDGRTFYAAYLKISKKGAFKLTIYDSARVEKPTISYDGTTYPATTQGVTYHRNYLYLSYSGESNPAIHNSYLVSRISYSGLFKGKYKTIKKMQVFSDRVDALPDCELARHIPEAIFFRNLNGSADCMYMSFNRANTNEVACDIDCLMRTQQKY